MSRHHERRIAESLALGNWEGSAIILCVALVFKLWQKKSHITRRLPT